MPKTINVYSSALQKIVSASSATGENGARIALPKAVAAITERLAALRGTPFKLIAVGNGGSAAVANHFALDLWNNAGIRAVSFSDPSLLTCMGNDYGYQEVFRKPLSMFSDKGDVLLAISSSGRSRNILHAVEEARARGLWCATFSGFGADNPLRRMGHVNLYVNDASYGMVELAHSVLCHYFSDILMEGR